MQVRGLAFAAVALAAGAAWAATGDALVVTGDGVNVRFAPESGAAIKLQLYRNHQVTELERQGPWVRVEIGGTAGEEGWIHGSLLAPIDGDALAPPPGGDPEPAAGPVAEPAAPAPAAQPQTIPQPAMPAPRGEAPAVAEGPAPETPAPETPATAAPAPETPATAAPLPATAPRDVAATTQEPSPSMPEPAAGPAAAELGGLERFRESVDYLNSRALEVAGVDLFTGVEATGGGIVQVGTTEAWSTVPPAGQRSYLNTLVDRWAAARGGTDPVSVQIVDESGNVVAEQSSP